MAFRVAPDGTVLVDSIDELREVLALKGIAVVQQSAPEPQRPTKPTPVPEAGNKSDSVQVFETLYASLPAEQQKLLRVLAHSKNSLSDADLREWLGLTSNVGLRGLLIGIVRRSRKAGLRDPIKRKMTRFDGGRRRSYRYSLHAGLFKYMERMGLIEKERTSAA